MKPVYAASERHKAYAISDVELKNVASIIKGFITVRCPEDIRRIDQIAEPISRNAEVLVLRVLAVDCLAERVRNHAGILCLGKRGNMKTSLPHAFCDFIERAAEEGRVGSINAVATTANIDYEATERTQPLTEVRL